MFGWAGKPKPFSAGRAGPGLQVPVGAPTSPPLRAAFLHLSPSPPRSQARRSHAHRRPSLRESPHPSGKAPPGGGRGRDRCPAPTAALEPPMEPRSAELRPERPRWERGAASPPPAARLGAERAGAAALPAPRLPRHSLPPSLPPCAAGPASAPVLSLIHI